MSTARDSESALAALQARLAEQEATEARLRAELAELRERLRTRTTAQERLAEMRAALSEELRKVREFASADYRQAEVESRAMVIAAEAEELRAERDDLRAERDGLRARVAALEAERPRSPAIPVIPDALRAGPPARVTDADEAEPETVARLEAARERLRSAATPAPIEGERTGGSPVRLLRHLIERAQSG